MPVVSIILARTFPRESRIMHAERWRRALRGQRSTRLEAAIVSRSQTLRESGYARLRQRGLQSGRGESPRKHRKKRHGGGGRRRAVRRLGRCGDGGMVLDIFSVDGEQGQGRKICSPRTDNKGPRNLFYCKKWTPSEKLDHLPEMK